MCSNGLHTMYTGHTSSGYRSRGEKEQEGKKERGSVFVMVNINHKIRGLVEQLYMYTPTVKSEA